ncbi:hypothetical protein KNP414_05095 [Paenibacillus mucilaginosus KNP414]|uniref:Uncharacterized protein n=1 Tax=Paenibacillus mucilaginosus (strain KNP414) TaxID=1036673 RepID=F8F6V3_PAEMK|nr:hypothetical protein KNP414_05095 [Paenibacillus mucilaginosus KNP414]
MKPLIFSSITANPIVKISQFPYNVYSSNDLSDGRYAHLAEEGGLIAERTTGGFDSSERNAIYRPDQHLSSARSAAERTTGSSRLLGLRTPQRKTHDRQGLGYYPVDSGPACHQSGYAVRMGFRQNVQCQPEKLLQGEPMDVLVRHGSLSAGPCGAAAVFKHLARRNPVQLR